MGQLLQPDNYAITAPELTRLYGAGVCVVETLLNLYVGRHSGVDRQCSLRFRATRGGRIDRIWAYLELVQPGYSGGTGGTIRFRVVADDGTSAHLPNPNVVYAEGSYRITQQDITAGRTIREFQLQPTSDVSAGTIYHVLCDNTDPGAGNYCSVNSTLVRAENGAPMRWTDAVDWAVLRKSGDSAWVDETVNVNAQRRAVPMMGLHYSSGEWQGYSAFESGAVASRSWRLTRDTSLIRERFTIDKNRRICGLSLYAACEVPGSMYVKADINGRQAFEFRINSTAVTYKPVQVGNNQIVNGAWYDVQLPHDTFARAGDTLDLYFVAEGSSVWWLGSQRNGSSRGSPVAFKGSETQIKRSEDADSWTPLNIHAHQAAGSIQDTSLRMVLHSTQHYSVAGNTAPPPPPPTGQGGGNLIEVALRAMADGHDVQYPGWAVPGGGYAEASPTHGAQRRGGSITMGGCVVPAVIEGTEYYNSLFDGGFNWSEMNTIKHRPCDQLALWGCIMAGDAKSQNTPIQIRYGALYILFEGDDNWYRILHYGPGGMDPVTWTYDQGPSMNPHGPERGGPHDRQYNTRQNHQRNIGNGVFEILTPRSMYLNNHFGNGDHLWQSNVPDRHRSDWTKVRGFMGEWEVRLHPDHTDKNVGFQVGMDPKWFGVNPPARGGWWPGIMLSRLQRVQANWHSVACVNVNTAHDSQRGGRVLTPQAIRNTIVPQR